MVEKILKRSNLADGRQIYPNTVCEEQLLTFGRSCSTISKLMSLNMADGRNILPSVRGMICWSGWWRMNLKSYYVYHNYVLDIAYGRYNLPYDSQCLPFDIFCLPYEWNFLCRMTCPHSHIIDTTRASSPSPAIHTWVCHLQGRTKRVQYRIYPMWPQGFLLRLRNRLDAQWRSGQTGTSKVSSVRHRN